MHLCRPFYKIMDSSNYIMHANDLRAGWRLFFKNHPKSCTAFSAFLVMQFRPHVFGMFPTLLPTHPWKLLFEACNDVRWLRTSGMWRLQSDIIPPFPISPRAIFELFLNDKRVDRKNKASRDCSVNVFWDPSGREMVERSWGFQSTDGNQEE